MDSKFNKLQNKFFNPELHYLYIKASFNINKGVSLCLILRIKHFLF